MNRFLKYWRLNGCSEAFRAEVVSYADDFVILSRGCATEGLQWTHTLIDRLGLSLNRDKTAVRDGRKEHFDFLAYSFGSMRFSKTGKRYMAAKHSKASTMRLKCKVRALLRSGEKAAWPDVRDRLNTLLRGWCTYFNYGIAQPTYWAVERNVYNRVRHFLVKRHKMSSCGIRRFPSEKVLGELGVLLPRPMRQPSAVCFEVKPVGKPDAVVPHVRFDERGWETELRDGLRHRHLAKAVGHSYCPSTKATAPIFDSTV